MSATDRPAILGPAPVFYLAAFLLVPGVHWLESLPIVGHPWIPWFGRAIFFAGLGVCAVEYFVTREWHSEDSLPFVGGA